MTRPQTPEQRARARVRASEWYYANKARAMAVAKRRRHTTTGRLQRREESTRRRRKLGAKERVVYTEEERLLRKRETARKASKRYRETHQEECRVRRHAWYQTPKGQAYKKKAARAWALTERGRENARRRSERHRSKVRQLGRCLTCGDTFRRRSKQALYCPDHRHVRCFSERQLHTIRGLVDAALQLGIGTLEVLRLVDYGRDVGLRSGHLFWEWPMYHALVMELDGQLDSARRRAQRQRRAA